MIALLAGVGFMVQNRGLLTSATEAQGFKAFLSSMPYLLCLMIALIVDKIIS
jgi:heme O synthase-like polyprenyltransferase